MKGFEVRSFDRGFGPRVTIGRHADALTEALAAAASGERFVVIYHQGGFGAVELLPYCFGPGDAITPDGGRGCGRGDVTSGYCPQHLATHHPEPESAGCPACGAERGDVCVAMTGGGQVRLNADVEPEPVLLCHEERHQAAIKADGRTCADQAPRRVQEVAAWAPATLF